MLVINLIKLIYQIFKVTRPIKPERTPIDVPKYDFDIISYPIARIKIEYNVIHPDMIYDKCMGEWGEYTIARSKYMNRNKFFAPCFTVPVVSSQTPFSYLAENIGKVRIVCVSYFKDNKRYIIFFAYPPYRLLFKLLNFTFRLYLVSHLLLSNYLEQLYQIIDFIIHKSEVAVLNVLDFVSFKRHLITQYFNYNGNKGLRFA